MKNQKPMKRPNNHLNDKEPAMEKGDVKEEQEEKDKSDTTEDSKVDNAPSGCF